MDAPLKAKPVPGNNAPFLDKRFREQFYRKNAPKTKYLKYLKDLVSELYR